MDNIKEELYLLVGKFLYFCANLFRDKIGIRFENSKAVLIVRMQSNRDYKITFEHIDHDTDKKDYIWHVYPKTKKMLDSFFDEENKGE